MNHLSNLPDDFCQAAFDRYYGAPLSDAAEEEWDRQSRIQAAIAVLREMLKAEEGNEALRTSIDYDELAGALKDATISASKLQDIISDADREHALCEMRDAAEYRAEMRRDAEGWA